LTTQTREQLEGNRIILDQITQLTGGKDLTPSVASLLTGLADALRANQELLARYAGAPAGVPPPDDVASKVLRAIADVEAKWEARFKALEAASTTARPKTYADALGANPRRDAAPPVENRFRTTIRPAKTIDPLTTSRALVTEINTRIGHEYAASATLRKSGEYEIAFYKADHKKDWLKNPEWAEAVFGRGSVARKPVCTLVAHGFNTREVRGKDGATLVAQFRRDNSTKITEVREPAKKLRREDRTTTLLISVDGVKEANDICERGIIWNAGLYRTSPFAPNAQVIRCYNCHRFGHIARMCKGHCTCGYCGQRNHPEEGCPSKRDGNLAHCVNCRGQHPAWARECPAAAKAAGAARDAFLHRPARFFTPTLAHPDSEGRATPTTAPPKGTNKRTVSKMDGPAQEPAKRGRPRGLTVAGSQAGQSDIRTSLLRRPTTNGEINVARTRLAHPTTTNTDTEPLTEPEIVVNTQSTEDDQTMTESSTEPEL
jgi:hypothetical protein